MSDPAHIIRNYRPGDFNRLVHLGAEVEKLGQPCCCTSLQDFLDSLHLPDHLPENNLFVVEAAGNLFGYLDVMPEPDIGRAVLSCLVHPGHRRKGLAKRLVDCGLNRARELGAKLAHANIPQENMTTKRLLSGMGFRSVRRFLELSLDLSKAHLPDTDQIVPQCPHLERGEEERLAQIQNRSFANTWGYSANTTEDIIHRTGLPSCSLEDIILARDSDKLIGFCWTKIDPGEQKAVNGSKGRVYMLGVDPDHRGKGIGKRLLLAGLSHLKGKRVRTVELTVDSENKAACGLYRSVGFKAWTSSLWYEKVLN